MNRIENAWGKGGLQHLWSVGLANKGGIQGWQFGSPSKCKRPIRMVDRKFIISLRQFDPDNFKEPGTHFLRCKNTLLRMWIFMYIYLEAHNMRVYSQEEKRSLHGIKERSSIKQQVEEVSLGKANWVRCSYKRIPNIVQREYESKQNCPMLSHLPYQSKINHLSYLPRLVRFYVEFMTISKVGSFFKRGLIKMKIVFTLRKWIIFFLLLFCRICFSNYQLVIGNFKIFHFVNKLNLEPKDNRERIFYIFC